MVNKLKSWGFPRWGEYGVNKDAVSVRLCDFHACSEKADHPAPKAPNSNVKWWFCQQHAAEYNKNWNFFEGLSAQEAKNLEQEELEMGKGYTQANTYSWGGAEDGDGLTGLEREAFEILELEATASAGEIKARYRIMAKRYHPDHNQDDELAEEMFQKVRAAYEALQIRVDKRSYKG